MKCTSIALGTALLLQSGSAALVDAISHRALHQESAPVAGSCNGDGGYSCPATDPVNVIVGEGYDPSAVDWGAVVADILQIGAHEPRFCNFAVRSWFHDVSGFHNNIRQGQNIHGDHLHPFDGASDGSFLTDFNETNHADGALHGFGYFTRHVLLQIAAAHGASHADVLTVAAAKCTSEVLHGAVDIAAHCEAQGVPLYVRPHHAISPI